MCYANENWKGATTVAYNQTVQQKLPLKTLVQTQKFIEFFEDSLRGLSLFFKSV